MPDLYRPRGPQPAKILKEPPETAEPAVACTLTFSLEKPISPAVNRILPELPSAPPPSAVVILIVPDSPFADVPVIKNNAPDTPLEPDTPVFNLIAPLVFVVPEPDFKEIAPPVNEVLDPPIKLAKPATPAAL